MAAEVVSSVEVIREAAQAAALLQPGRLQLLRGLAAPDSAAGLARRLGMPRQRVNYHLRELEKHGLVELVAEQQKGNCVERLVRATARSYLISPEVLGALAADPGAVEDRVSAIYLVAVAARTIREVAVLLTRAAKAGKRLATLSLQSEVRFASAAASNAFANELATELARLVAKYHDERARSGRRFRIFCGAYPVITRTSD
jgi:DNA-binding transcriptional ArsR family regulator